MYTHLGSVGWLEAVGGGAGVPAVVLGGDAAEAEGGAALVEGGVALLVPLHLEYSIIVMLFNNEIFKCHFQEKTEISQYKLHSDKSQNNVIVGPYDSP